MPITVQEVMATPPVTIAQHATIDQAVELLLEKGLGEIYVTNAAGRLVGVVPDYELLKAQLAETRGDAPIESLMSRSIATAGPNCPVSELAPAFRASFCRKIAVVEDGVLLGQIDRRDVLAALRNSRGAAFRPAAVETDAAGREGAGLGGPANGAVRSPRFMTGTRRTTESAPAR